MIWKSGFVLSCDTDFIFDLGQHLILDARNANTVGPPFGGGGGKGKYRKFNHQDIKNQGNTIIIYQRCFL